MLQHFNGRLLVQILRPVFHLHIDTTPVNITVSTHTHTTTAPLPSNLTSTPSTRACGECFAVLVALQLWGVQWAETEVSIHCTDPVSLQILVHGRSRNQFLLAIARRIWLITAQFDIWLTPSLPDLSMFRGARDVAPPVLDFT
jgi:hypothetical protein